MNYESLPPDQAPDDATMAPFETDLAVAHDLPQAEGTIVYNAFSGHYKRLEPGAAEIHQPAEQTQRITALRNELAVSVGPGAAEDLAKNLTALAITADAPAGASRQLRIREGENGQIDHTGRRLTKSGQHERTSGPDQPNAMLDGLISLTGAKTLRDDFGDNAQQGIRVYKGLLASEPVYFEEHVRPLPTNKVSNEGAAYERRVYAVSRETAEGAVTMAIPAGHGPLPVSSPQERRTNAQEFLAQDSQGLATSSIEHKYSLGQKALTEAEQKYQFESDYQPTHPGPRPHEEAGGMDHQDWQIAAMEYADDMEYRDERIDAAARHVADNRDHLEELRTDYDLIRTGDSEVIETEAAAEQVRLEKIVAEADHAEATYARQSERRLGREFEGGIELYNKLQAALTDQDDYVRNQPGPHGWEYSYRAAADRLTFISGATDNAFSQVGQTGGFTHKLDVWPDAVDGITLRLQALPADASASELSNGHRVDGAHFYQATIMPNGMVKRQLHATGHITFISGAKQPVMHSADRSIDVDELDFGQEDFDYLDSLSNQAISDIEKIAGDTDLDD